MDPTLIDYQQFQAVDIRVGTIVSVEPFPEARKPAWKLRIDFGAALGVKRSSARISRCRTVDACSERLRPAPAPAVVAGTCRPRCAH